MKRMNDAESEQALKVHWRTMFEEDEALLTSRMGAARDEDGCEVGAEIAAAPISCEDQNAGITHY